MSHKEETFLEWIAPNVLRGIIGGLVLLSVLTNLKFSIEQTGLESELIQLKNVAVHKGCAEFTYDDERMQYDWSWKDD